ncbi:MAG: hypothetical protein ABJM29_15570 [Rhizobiaceae bacterium]
MRLSTLFEGRQMMGKFLIVIVNAALALALLAAAGCTSTTGDLERSRAHMEALERANRNAD